MKGSYALLVHLKNEDDIRVGALGIVHFPKGYYMYIGSAMNGIEGRVKRHLRDEKEVHWHIDYLLDKAEIAGVYYLESSRRTECSLATKFAKKFHVVSGFGSSDCYCLGHLFYGSKKGLILCAQKNGMKKLNLKNSQQDF